MKLESIIELRCGGPGSGRKPGECPGGACEKHPVEGHGIKGLNNNRWRKTFKTSDHLNNWAEKNSADVHGLRFLKNSEIPSNWQSSGYHEAPTGQ